MQDFIYHLATYILDVSSMLDLNTSMQDFIFHLSTYIIDVSSKLDLHRSMQDFIYHSFAYILFVSFMLDLQRSILCSIYLYLKSKFSVILNLPSKMALTIFVGQLLLLSM